MLDIDTRRLERAARRAENEALELGIPLDTLPTPEALLADAEARASHDRYALAGIGRVEEYRGRKVFPNAY